MPIGYARVSTLDQTLALQEDALTAAKCERIFRDTASGAKVGRPGLAAALSSVRSGDTHVVWRMDRLGWFLRHLIETVNDLEKPGIGFRSLTENIDTTTSGASSSSIYTAALPNLSERWSSSGRKGGRPRDTTLHDTKKR